MGVRGWLGAKRRSLAALDDLGEMREQNRFLLHEVRRLNEQLRALLAGTVSTDAQSAQDAQGERGQTKASFEFQWHSMAEGAGLPSDVRFMEQLPDQLCKMTGFDRGWFVGKRVVDVGCGLGRFTFGLLTLGAHVTACDQSPSALERTRTLCAPFAERLVTRRVDLLDWREPAAFDLAFSFGVVHHTGNTYLAIRNVANKVGAGGRVFLMVYGRPSTVDELREVNSYEDLRQEMRLVPLEERRSRLLARFGPELAHGWFDAVSPRINDLLSYTEIAELLGDLGFRNPRRTMDNRNVHLIADR